MCVLYVSFGSKIRPRTYGCVAMRSALLFIFRSRLLLYSAGFGVKRVQVVLHRCIGGLNCWPREQFTHTMAVLTESSNI